MDQTTTPLFYRDGRPFTGTPSLTDKGAPYTTHPRTCSRCGGAGGADKWAHTGFTCYDCGGTGRRGDEVDKLYTADKLAKLNATKANTDARKSAKRAVDAAQRQADADANREKILAEYAPLFDLGPFDDFSNEIVVTATSEAWMSERQIEVLGNSFCRRILNAERRAAAHHVGTVGERISLTATVECAEAFDSD